MLIVTEWLRNCKFLINPQAELILTIDSRNLVECQPCRMGVATRKEIVKTTPFDASVALC
jgi:hypothetical protein